MQQLEKEILDITRELGQSQADYESLRKQYVADWTLKDPSKANEILEQMKDLAAELSHYNSLFNTLARKYAMLVAELSSE